MEQKSHQIEKEKNKEAIKIKYTQRYKKKVLDIGNNSLLIVRIISIVSFVSH